MQFLYPTFLIASLAIAIPIIIHLFYFRRFKKVYFSNVKFLKEVKEETSARQKLRNLLVLLMRCLAVLAMVVAFAQPFIPQGTAVKQGDNTVSIFVDNSFSMQALSTNVPLIDKAKQRAREIINAYREEDRFQVLTNNFDGKHQRLVSKEEALGLVDEIRSGPAVRKVSQVLSRQRQILSTSTAANQVCYIISDFQKNITDLDNVRDTSLKVNLIPLQSVQENNVGIDSAWFEAPVRTLNQPNKLIVSVRNHGNENALDVPLSVTYNGETKPVGLLNISSGGSALDTVFLNISSNGWQEAELSLTDYPIQFDDRYYFTFHVEEFLNVLVINEQLPDSRIGTAFASAGFFRVSSQPARNLDYSTFPSYHLIVCNGVQHITSGLSFELTQYLNNGGKVVAFPPSNADLASWNDFLRNVSASELGVFEEVERVVADVNTEEFVFLDVFENTAANLRLPVTKGNFRLAQSASIAEEKLLTYRDGQTFLGKYKTGKGILYLFSAPLEERFSNLVQSGEVFVPMLYKMAISSARSRPIAYTIGANELIESDNVLSAGERVYRLRSEREEFIPQQRRVASRVYLTVGEVVRNAGYYDLFIKPDTILAKFAFNYDRRESNLQYFSVTELEQAAPEFVSIVGAGEFASLTEVISERKTGIVLWRYFVILALIALATEAVILRFCKTGA